MLTLLLLSCASNDADSGVSDSTTAVPTELSTIDPDTLPQGDNPCRPPELVFVYDAIDGDTIHVSSSKGTESIRLIGVDTPEVGWNGEPSDCYGQEAQAFTRELLEDKQVWLTFDGSCTDAYDRTLAYVHVGNGDQDFFERQLLRRGYGTAFPWSGTDTFEDTFADDESQAMSEGAGLWSACN